MNQMRSFLRQFVFVLVQTGQWAPVACLNLSNCAKLPAIKTHHRRKKENVSEDEAAGHRGEEACYSSWRRRTTAGEVSDKGPVLRGHDWSVVYGTLICGKRCSKAVSSDETCGTHRCSMKSDFRGRISTCLHCRGSQNDLALQHSNRYLYYKTNKLFTLPARCAASVRRLGSSY